MEKISRIRKFIEVDLWRIRTKSLPKSKRYTLEFLKVWIIAIKEFIVDKCAEKASALTYLSMLSLVPVIAMAIAIAKAFGLRKVMEDELKKYFTGQDEILENILPAVDNMLASSGSGIATTISIIFLLYTVIKLLMNIEEAFNDMWDIKKSRRWERKISDYVAVILLGPILLIVASSATVFVKDTIQGLVTSLEFLGQAKSGIFFLLKLLPYTILWLLLFGLYLIFPNTRVKVFPALLAGVIAGTLYQLNQQAFISMQFAFARYDAIYGSIAFIPLFLIWLQISWLIVLFGAEICYGAQYHAHWEMNSESLKISLKHRKKLVLLILYRIVKKFEEEDGGYMTLDQIGERMNVPRRYISDICFDLENAKLITRIDSDDTAYQPSFDIHKMNFLTILQRYEAHGMTDFDPRKTKVFEKIETKLEEIDKKWGSSEVNILLRDL